MRLISADKLCAILVDWQLNEMPEEGVNYKSGRKVTDHERQYELYILLDEVIKEVAEQEKVDAEPVRHGRWIEVDVGDCCYRCSECGFIRDAYLLDIGNYCPKCGAKMDGERE